MMQSKKVTVAQNDVISTHCYMFSEYQLPVELLPAAAPPPLLQPPTLPAVVTRHRHHKMRHGYYTPPCVLARFV